MDLEGHSYIQRGELTELLYHLNDPEPRGVLLFGDPGAGKTVLLYMAAGELKRQGRAVFIVSFRDLRDPGELGIHVLDAIAASPFIDGEISARTIRTSAGVPPLHEAAEILRHAGARMSSPVLLFDGLDESVYPHRMAAAVEEFSLALDGWKLVVASRPAVVEIGRFTHFAVIRLRGLAEDETAAWLRQYASGPSEDIIPRIVELARGNALILGLMARELQRSGSLTTITDSTSLTNILERLVNEAVETSLDPSKLSELLEELALAGGRDRITALASKSRITEEEVRRLLEPAGASVLLVFDYSAGTVALYHTLVRDAILSRRILTCPFRLADLKFGAEEAERDELLDESFVRRRSLEAIFDWRRSIIVGDRGSGKSAIFCKLAADTFSVVGQRVEIYPVANTGDLLHRIVDKDAWADAEGLRAAWLVLISAVIASTVPASAPKSLRRNAIDLRAAFAFPTELASPVRRALYAAVRPLGGTTLKFAVGPVKLEAKLPSGSGGRSSKASIDIESFLQEVDGLLCATERRVVVILDRIDETFKYDRVKQEVVVQALLQAEGRISRLGCIGVVVFLRTDLFELYDIQEKNKIVSRTLALDWSEEEWLQVLVKRVLANKPFRALAERLHVEEGAAELHNALKLLFPPEIEGQPVDRWLIESLRNGNGDVSPRLAVLLLHLARELSPRSADVVSTIPLFSANAVRKAMTKLSDLSFSEIVNDFKVAPSFVLNCRAGKLDSFVLREVEELFDETEGKISEQVRLLERLGFLERVVQESDSSVGSLFRIPKLYTRCWDYA